jgi:pyruvate dehydrogenase E2 component (dihydrolipoamide acetyltransferase)
VQIDDKLKELVKEIKTGLPAPASMANGILTISNLGMYEIESFTAVIPPNQSGILTIGKTENMPVFDSNTFKFEPIVKVILTVDHRLINGSEAAMFLSELKESIENIE